MQQLNQDTTRKPLFRRALTTYVTVILFIAVFWAGFWAGNKKADHVIINEDGVVIKKNDFTYGGVADKFKNPPEYLADDTDFDLYWDAWNIIQTRYVDRPAGETRLLYGSIAGMVASLGDPFTTFLDPEVTQNFTEELTGEIEGIGAEIGIKNDLLTVVSPLPGSPAMQAGLLAQDIIWEIDGEETAAMPIDTAVSKIRGQKGTDVVLSVSQGLDGQRRDITITRDRIEIVSAELEMLRGNESGIPDDKTVGLITLSHFNADTAARMKTIVQDIILEQPDALVLDLRNNPGGFLDQAISIAGMWVAPGGVVVRERSADGSVEEHKAQGRAEFASIPTVVLINEGSASGSEIVAGALQDHELAHVVGETSFGKGSVQVIEHLRDGASIKVTVAKWLTPNSNEIDLVGIIPDTEVVVDELADDETADDSIQLESAFDYLFE